MSDHALHRLADAAGLLTEWIDYRGVPRSVSADSLRAVLATLELPCTSSAELAASLRQVEAEQAQTQLPAMLVVRCGEPVRTGLSGRLSYRIDYEQGGGDDGWAEPGDDGIACLPAIAAIGYHRLHIAGRETCLAVAPARCFGVADALSKRRAPRVWGIAAQLYSLRRRGDGGIGDFTALAELARAAARHGADALAVSPVHALFAADASRYSAYSPSSRLFVNALHADAAEALGAGILDAVIAAEGLAPELAALERLELIDWPAATAVRHRLLRALHARWSAEPAVRHGDYRRYLAEAGPGLIDHARFEALHAHFLGESPALWHWRDWPAAYRDPRSAEVAAFAVAHAGEIDYHLFLQWLADRGLGSAQRAARDAGMAIGLIGDLAVGTDGGGSHAWSRQQDLLIGVGVGAPPDALNALGQSWGLTAFSPRAMRRNGYAPFLEMLRTQLRHAGGLRIDHVIGLGRLWLVPDGAHPTLGAYLRYPKEDLFALIALESWRHRAVIIGEDMGTVPEGFRQPMAAAGILGMRVLWFERDWGLYVEPQRWPEQVVAMTTTHDLPTVAGWWQGRDIDWRAALKLYGEGQDEAGDRAARRQDRIKLWAAFVHAGVASGAAPAEDEPESVVDAAAAFIGRTPSPLALLPAEDVLGLSEQPNVPGTVAVHPNWCRRLPVDAAIMLDDPRCAARLRALAEGRIPSRQRDPV